MGLIRRVVRQLKSVRGLASRVETIEQNLRELNRAAEDVDRRVDALAVDELPGLFLAAERSAESMANRPVDWSIERQQRSIEALEAQLAELRQVVNALAAQRAQH